MKNKWELLFLIVGSLLLAACQGETAKRLWLKAPDWSRAQVVGGMGIPDPAPVVVDETGNIYFLFIDGELETLQARVVSFNSQAEPRWEHTFSEILRLPHDPQLVWEGQMLHAFWVSDGALLTARFDSNGTVQQEPVVISHELQVNSYYAVGDGAGRLAVWFATDRRQPSLYQADVNLNEEPILVDEEGVLPALRFDNRGTLHALWAHYPRDNPQTTFLYAAYPGGQFAENAASVIFETRIPQTADMVGPTLGLDSANVYIYWVEIFRTGLEAGFTESRYLSFPIGAPEEVTAPQEIFIPEEHDLTYEPFPGGTLQAGERYLLASQPASLSVLQDIYPNPVQVDELVISFRASVNYYWRRDASQIGLLYLQDGLPTSYQLLSFTQRTSADPTVITDSNKGIYVTWLESGDVSRFDVFLAATTQGIQDAFNPVTVNDVTGLIGETIFGLLTGILLAPIAAVLWFILPLIVVLVTSIFRRGDQTILSPGTIITLVPAVAIFQVAKFASLPDIVNYVPFSAWLPLPEWLKTPLQIAVPVLIMIAAVMTAWHYTYRRQTDSPMYFIILYVATDALLTMAVYGVLFYGAF